MTTPPQGTGDVEEVALQLLASVTSTVRPLVVATGETGSGAGKAVPLSPGVERVTGRMLALALEMGLKVRSGCMCRAVFY